MHPHAITKCRRECLERNWYPFNNSENPAARSDCQYLFEGILNLTVLFLSPSVCIYNSIYLCQFAKREKASSSLSLSKDVLLCLIRRLMLNSFIEINHVNGTVKLSGTQQSPNFRSSFVRLGKEGRFHPKKRLKRLHFGKKMWMEISSYLAFLTQHSV